MYEDEIRHYVGFVETDLLQFLRNIFSPTLKEIGLKCSHQTLCLLEWELAKRWGNKYEATFPIIRITSIEISNRHRFAYISSYLFQRNQWKKTHNVSFIKPYKRQQFLNWVGIQTTNPFVIDCLDVLAILFCRGLIDQR